MDQRRALLSSTGGAGIGVENLTCEMAAAVTLWVEREVQPLAQEMFGQRVTEPRRLRNLRLPQHHRQSDLEGHAQPARLRQRALDISRLHIRRRAADLCSGGIGRRKALKANFCTRPTGAPAAGFAWRSAPTSTTPTKNHFHFDRGLMWSCK